MATIYKKAVDNLRKLNEQKLKQEIEYQSACYGSVLSKRFKRGWYNPMRYILGKEAIKIINVKEFYHE